MSGDFTPAQLALYNQLVNANSLAAIRSIISNATINLYGELIFPYKS